MSKGSRNRSANKKYWDSSYWKKDKVIEVSVNKKIDITEFQKELLKKNPNIVIL